MADQEEKVDESTDAQAEPAEAVEETGAAAAAAGTEAAAGAESAAAEPEPAPEGEPEPAADEAPAAAEAAPEEEYTYEILHKMTVADLRDIAQGIEHDALVGYSTMHKEHLVPALCAALGIEAHVHHEVVGINKDRVKRKIRDLKVERQKALDAGDHAQLKLVRKRIKSLKRKIRRATV